MDILHWLELHADVRVHIGYLEPERIYFIAMTNDEKKLIRKESSTETLNRAKYTITDILDGMYEELKEK